MNTIDPFERHLVAEELDEFVASAVAEHRIEREIARSPHTSQRSVSSAAGSRSPGWIGGGAPYPTISSKHDLSSNGDYSLSHRTASSAAAAALATAAAAADLSRTRIRAMSPMSRAELEKDDSHHQSTPHSPLPASSSPLPSSDRGSASRPHSSYVSRNLLGSSGGGGGYRSPLLEANDRLSTQLHSTRQRNIELRAKMAQAKKEAALHKKETERLRREKAIADAGFARSYTLEQSHKHAARRAAVVKDLVSDTVRKRLVNTQETIEMQAELMTTQEEELATLNEALMHQATLAERNAQQTLLLERALEETTHAWHTRQTRLLEENLQLADRCNDDVVVSCMFTAVSSLLRSMRPDDRLSEDDVAQIAAQIEQGRRSRLAAMAESEAAKHLLLVNSINTRGQPTAALSSPPMSPPTHSETGGGLGKISRGTVDILRALDAPLPPSPSPATHQALNHSPIPGSPRPFSVVAEDTLDLLVRRIRVTLSTDAQRAREQSTMAAADHQAMADAMDKSRARLAESEARVSTLEMERAVLQQQVTGMNDKVHEEQLRVSKLERDLTHAERQQATIEALRAVVAEEREKNSQLLAELAQTGREKASTQRDLTSKSSELDDADKEVRHLRSEAMELRRDRDTTKLESIRISRLLETKIAELEDRVLQAEAARDAVLNDLTRARQKMYTMEEEREDLIRQRNDQDKSWQSVQGALWNLAR